MRIWIVVPILLTGAASVYAANDCRTPVDLSPSSVPPIEVPQRATAYAVVAVADDSSPPGVSAPAISAGTVTFAGPFLDLLRSAHAIKPYQLVWKDSGGSEVCRQELTVAAGTQVSTPAASVSLADCIDSAKRWIASIASDRKLTGARHDFTAIVFMESGAVCHRNRDYGVAGDPIYVGLVTRDDTVRATSVSFVPCEIEKEEPTVRVDAGLDGFRPHSAMTRRAAPPVSPLYEGRVCFNRDVTIEVAVTPTGKDPQTWRHAIAQHVRYRATAQIGILSTDLHDSDFALITDAGGTQIVFDKGPEDSGPEWYANVVVYGIAHYLRDLGGKTRYQGRDILHDQRWSDRLGLFFGVSLSEPADRVSAGFAFELLAGVNLLGGYERAKVNELVGLSSGDAFSGAESSLPIREEWDGGWRLGVALDLRYLTALFQRK
jgi:hypothetical protein